jgi:tetratricopeptide (TPR) repeat protein
LFRFAVHAGWFRVPELLPLGSMNVSTRTGDLVAILRVGACIAVLNATIQACFADSDAYTNGVSSHIVRAIAYGELHDWDKMIAQCNEAIRLNPNAIDAYRGLGAAYAEKEDWRNVITNYSEVLRLDPNDQNVRSYIADAYTKVGNYDMSIDNYSIYLDHNPNSSGEYGGRAYAYAQKGEIDKAMSDYAAAIKCDPKNTSAYFYRGYEYATMKDWDKAISDFSEVLRLSPKTVQANYYRGYAYQAKGIFDKAASDYLKCSEAAPNQVSFWSCLNSVAWELATNPDASVRNGKESLSIAKRTCHLSNWSDWQFVDTLAAAYAETGDFQNAIKYQQMVTNMQRSAGVQERFGLVKRLQVYEKGQPFRDVIEPHSKPVLPNTAL